MVDDGPALAAVLAEGSLDGHVALVTGGGSGLGRAIARRMNELGARVWVVGRTEADLAATVDGCARPVRAHWRTVDVRDHEAFTALVAEIGDTAGLDVLVNSAGGQFFAPATDISAGGWHAVLELNLDAVFWACTAAYPYLRRSRHASILNLSLSGVERGGMGMAHSVAARSGVLGLSRTLALEWAGDGIRVNCLGPGTVITERLEANADPEVLDALVAATPLGRATQPGEVAEMACVLASRAGAMTTGQLIQVDGGASLGAGLHMIDAPT